MARSCYLFVHVISLSLIMACSVCHSAPPPHAKAKGWRAAHPDADRHSESPIDGSTDSPVDGSSDSTTDGNSQGEVACNLQQRIEQASSGDTIDGGGCIERSALELRKSLTLKNLTIKGSDDWSGDFTGVGGNYRSSRAVPEFIEPSETDDPYNPYLCEVPDTDQLCREAEMVFVNDAYQRQVADGSDPGPGEFALDSQRHVVLGEDPGDARVEVVVRQVGLHMFHGSAGTVLDNVLVTEVGNTVGQQGTGAAIRNNGRTLTVKNSTVSWVHGTGLSCGGGVRCEITGTEVHHAGSAGLTSWKASPLVFDNNLIHDNCMSLPDVPYNDTFECSGIKIVGESPEGRTLTNNEFHHNRHAGIWLDISADNTTIANNRIHDNAERGIEVEITSGVTIRDNVIFANGWVGTPSDAFNSGGIYILDSGNVKIYRNVMAWNRDGFAYIGGRRQNVNTGIEMYNNDIICGANDPGEQMIAGWLLRGDALGSYIAHDNRYYYGGQGNNSDTRKFRWENTFYTSLAEFNSTPGEENSRWLSSEEVSSILSANDIPTQ